MRTPTLIAITFVFFLTACAAAPETGTPASAETSSAVSSLSSRYHLDFAAKHGTRCAPLDFQVYANGTGPQEFQAYFGDYIVSASVPFSWHILNRRILEAVYEDKNELHMQGLAPYEDWFKEGDCAYVFAPPNMNQGRIGSGQSYGISVYQMDPGKIEAFKQKIVTKDPAARTWQPVEPVSGFSYTEALHDAKYPLLDDMYLVHGLPEEDQRRECGIPRGAFLIVREMDGPENNRIFAEFLKHLGFTPPSCGE